jgi:methionine synthase II (cobalamin-independent)
MSSKLHQRPPFRAEHLGSLLRPAELLKTRAAVDKKEAKKADLTAIEDKSVKEIVQTQIDLGFHPISDGEYRRHMFWYVQIS